LNHFSADLGIPSESDFLRLGIRQQAAMYRQLAEKTEDALIQARTPRLGSGLDEVANNIEDRLTSG
jgi:hypothetical protein